MQQHQIVWLAFLILFQSAGALYKLINTSELGTQKCMFICLC